MSLHVDHRDAVCILTLDDPARRNAMSGGLVDEIKAAFAAIEADDRVGAVVLTGAPPAFCSGADLGDLAAMGSGGGGESSLVRSVYEVFFRIRDCNVPTIAAVNGPALGAGMNLALACDVRLASPAARFESRFAMLGVHPGGGHVWMLERAAGPQAAAAMTLLGERVDGRRAEALGLVWRCVDDGELLDTACELAARAATVPRELARRLKATLRDVPWQPTFASAVATEFEHQRWSFAQGLVDPSRGPS